MVWEVSSLMARYLAKFLCCQNGRKSEKTSGKAARKRAAARSWW